MKYVSRLSAVMLLLSILLCGCTQPTPPTTTLPPQAQENTDIQSALDFYIDCIELMKTDFRKVITDHCHYESSDAYEFGLNSPMELISCDILRIEQLSDELWIVEAFYVCEEVRFGFYDVNYLARIDDAWKVMMTIEQIPEALKEGVEFEEYNKESPGIVDPATTE